MDVTKLFQSAVEELEKMLSSKSVVGEPIELGKTTVVPLVSLGFGFGVGTSQESGGMGGGGGVKPVAVVILDERGARMETVKMSSSALGKVADTVGELARAKLIGPNKDDKKLAEKSENEGE